MVNVTDTTKNAYKRDSVTKNLEVRIPEADIILHNEDLVSQSLSLTESIESSDNLSFTGCIASVLKFKCADIVQDLEGMWIEVDLTAEDTETIPLFRGYIEDQSNPSHEQNTMEITAYDALKKINEADVTSWYNGLTFPITIMNMRNSFFTHFGIDQVDDYLPNDTMTVNQTIEDKTINGAKIIKSICQINGRYGRIGRTGDFEYVHLVEGTEALYPREDLYPADDIYPSDENALDNVNKAHYTNISFENYRVQPIDKVQLIGKDGTVVAARGAGNNVFTVKDNPLIWSKSSAELASVVANLYSTVQGLWYVPADVQCVGLPYVECGDFVLMATKRSIVRAYVLNRNLTGIQALKDSYQAPGDKTQPEYKPSVQTQITANTHAINTEASVRAAAITSEATTRQNQINSEANTRQNQINAVNVRCDTLNAEKASIGQLNAESASIRSLVADNISSVNANIENLRATKASIGELNVVRATVDTINANYITASRVDSKIASALYNVNTSTLTCNSISLRGHRFDGTVRIVTTYHGYDCIGNQVY